MVTLLRSSLQRRVRFRDSSRANLYAAHLGWGFSGSDLPLPLFRPAGLDFNRQ